MLFMLTLSIHFCCVLSKQFVLYTLQSDVWFTLSKCMLGFILFFFTGFHFSMPTLSKQIQGVALCIVVLYSLSKRMLLFKILQFYLISCLHAYTLHICFSVHSPNHSVVYTLQGVARFTLSQQMSGFKI